MEFKWDINLGTILTIATVVVTLVGIYGHAAVKFKTIEQKLNVMFSWWCREILKDGNDSEVSKDIQKFFK